MNSPRACVEGIGNELLDGLVRARVETLGEQLDDSVAETDLDVVGRIADSREGRFIGHGCTVIVFRCRMLALGDLPHAVTPRTSGSYRCSRRMVQRGRGTSTGEWDRSVPRRIRPLKRGETASGSERVSKQGKVAGACAEPSGVPDLELEPADDGLPVFGMILVRAVEQKRLSPVHPRCRVLGRTGGLESAEDTHGPRGIRTLQHAEQRGSRQDRRTTAPSPPVSVLIVPGIAHAMSNVSSHPLQPLRPGEVGVDIKHRWRSMNYHRYGFIPSKRSVSFLNNTSDLSNISDGISVESAVDHATTIRRAISGFHPSGSLTPYRSAALLICATRLPSCRDHPDSA